MSERPRFEAERAGGHRPRPRDRRRRRDGGAVPLLLLLVMVALLSLGIMSIWLTSGNLQISSSMNLRAQALYCAQAGIERARAYLNTANPAATSPFLEGLLPGRGQLLDDVPTTLDAKGQ